ncbi:hypothetical protein [Candidatus Methylocalor cossyra]|uniref:hypothetical protein n=1 Tax=Candidatus Methylocalor cossyra TaxID=3108543 RepID=UPI0032B1955F
MSVFKSLSRAPLEFDRNEPEPAHPDNQKIPVQARKTNRFTTDESLNRKTMTIGIISTGGWAAEIRHWLKPPIGRHGRQMNATISKEF